MVIKSMVYSMDFITPSRLFDVACTIYKQYTFQPQFTYHPLVCTAYYAQLSVTAECATRTRDAKLSRLFLWGEIGVACETMFCLCVCFPYSGTSRNQAYKQQYQRLQRDTGMKYKMGFFFKTLRSEVMASFTHLE